MIVLIYNNSIEFLYGCVVLLQLDPKLPGVILSEPPRQKTITSKGGEIDLEEEIGSSIVVPRNSTARDEPVDFATGFSGLYELPEGVESVSPAYLIKTTKKVKFSKDIAVRLQHNANLQTAEDCKAMVFLKASVTPTHKGSNSSLKFEEIKGTKAEFSQGKSNFGVIKLKHLFSWFKIGRKKRKNSGKGKSI